MFIFKGVLSVTFDVNYVGVGNLVVLVKSVWVEDFTSLVAQDQVLGIAELLQETG